MKMFLIKYYFCKIYFVPYKNFTIFIIHLRYFLNLLLNKNYKNSIKTEIIYFIHISILIKLIYECINYQIFITKC